MDLWHGTSNTFKCVDECLWEMACALTGVCTTMCLLV